MNNSVQYMLVIKADKNNYQPLEWNQIPKYKETDLNSLEGIDKFTSQFEEHELIEQLIDKSLVELTDFFQKFTIIYKEKGRLREIKDGIIFPNIKDAINDNKIIELLKENYSNKNLINYVANIVYKNINNQANKEFLLILKNLDYFAEKSNNALLAALDKYKELTYKEKRTLGVNILKKLNK